MSDITNKPNYKDVANYLRNEQGIDRDYIEQVLEKSIKNTVKQFLKQKISDEYLNKEIQYALMLVLTDSSSTWNRESTKDLFKKKVMAEVSKSIGKVLEKDFKVVFTVHPNNNSQ